MTLINILWIVQFVFCLWLGPKVARRTGRSVLNWVLMGFLMAIIFPPFGIILMILAYFFYPPASPRVPRQGANPRAPHDQRGGTKKL